MHCDNALKKLTPWQLYSRHNARKKQYIWPWW